MWDYAPGALLVQEAGGIAANVDGQTYTDKHYDFIASNIDAYDHLSQIVRGVGFVAISE